MTREFIDLLTFNEECIRFGEDELDYSEVIHDEVNYIKHGLDTDKEKINVAKGSELDRNKKIVRQTEIDVLINPVSSYERPFDESTATVAKENEVTVGMTLKSMLGYSGMDKTQYFRSLEYLGKLIRRTGCNFILTSGAEDKLEMRRPRDLASLGYIMGFDEESSLNAVSSNVKKITNK